MNLKTMLLDEFAFYGVPAIARQIEMWADELSDLNLFDVKAALLSLRKDPERTRPPLPAAIRDEIYNYPAAEEAWAMCPKNEVESIVWTDEMSTAYAACRKLIATNDFVGARMTFKEVYEREVQKAKSEMRKPKWWPSFGEDKDSRSAALVEAVSKNRMDSAMALKYMPELALQEPGKPRLMLTTNLTQDDIDDQQREVNLRRVRELLDMLETKQKKMGGNNGV